MFTKRTHDLQHQIKDDHWSIPDTANSPCYHDLYHVSIFFSWKNPQMLGLVFLSISDVTAC